MQITIEQGCVTVTRLPGDKRIAKESTFWYALQKKLNQDSGQWYRIRPHKFALTSMPFALREGRQRKRNRAIIDRDYAIRCPQESYNRRAPVHLDLITLEG